MPRRCIPARQRGAAGARIPLAPGASPLAIRAALLEEDRGQFDAAYAACAIRASTSTDGERRTPQGL